MLTTFSRGWAAPAVCLATLLTAGLSHAQSSRYALGTLDGFYRNSAVQAQSTTPDQHLKPIPSYWLNNDFSYQSKNTPAEVPFADRISVVRPLGGWRSLPLGSPNPTPLPEEDVVFRQDDGSLGFRFDKLKARLDPYLNNSPYRNVVIALDNTPYALAGTSNVGFYGQINPPQAMAEWEETIGQTVGKLVEWYGQETVSSWTLRMGTEYNNNEFFNGDQSQFHEMYDRAYRAAQAAAPGIKFGPMEVSGFSAIRDDLTSDFHNISLFRLAEHQFDGATPIDGVPAAGTIDHVAASMHFLPRDNGSGTLIGVDPAERVNNTIKAFERLAAAHPELADGQVPWEVHQFGVLTSELNDENGQTIATTEPGSRGAAQNLHALIEFKRQGVDSVWHWNVTEKVPVAGQEIELLDGNGWVMAVLDHMRGGNAYVLDVDTGGPADANGPSSNHVSDGGTQYKTLASVSDDGDTGTLLLSSFNVDRYADDTQMVDIFLPKADFDLSQARLTYTALTQDTSLYDRIRQDLEREGLLDETFVDHPELVSTLAAMAGDSATERFPARKYVADNWAMYEDLFTDSLTLKTFEGQLDEFENVYRLRAQLDPDAVYVWRFEPIPEPGVAGLLTAGFLLLARRRRDRST